MVGLTICPSCGQSHGAAENSLIEIARLRDKIAFARAHLSCIKDLTDVDDVNRQLTMAMDTLAPF